MAIVSLAHNLRLTVIAEGVETAEQLSFLRLLKCDEGQGYLFSKPVPHDAFASFVRDPKRRLYVVADSKLKVVSEFPSAVNE